MEATEALRAAAEGQDSKVMDEAALPSTARRSRCRPGMRSAGTGRCQPFRWTSNCRPASTSSIAADGSRERPVMIHRALFGSIERFFAVLLEHYSGAFPPWLAPVQVVAIPVADEHVEYLESVAAELRSQGVPGRGGFGPDRMGKKIRNATKSKVPFILIAGDDDRAAELYRSACATAARTMRYPADAVARIVSAIETRIQV